MRDVIPAFRPPRARDPLTNLRRGSVILAALCLVAFTASLSGCGSDPETRLAEARALQDAGDFSSSIETLRAVLATEPDNEEANYLLGVALVQTRQPSLAIWPLRKAADSEKYGLTGGLLLASTLLQTEGYEEALAVTDKILQKHPDHLTALLIRVHANLATGHEKEALADSEHMLQLDPDHFQAQVSRATALQKLGRMDEAEAAWIHLSETGAKSGDPATVVRSCLALAQFYQSTDSDKAGKVVRKCVDENPSDTIALQVASDYYDRKKHPEEATALWERAVKEEPDSFDLRVGLAQRYAGHGAPDKAEKELVETAQLFDDARSWDKLAIHYQSQGKLDKAREAVDHALERKPANPEPLLFRKADLLVTAGKLDEAEKLAEGFQQPAYRDLITARVLDARGDTKGALEAAESGIARWPNNAPARYLAGQLAEKLGERAKALSHYREATRKDPDATDAALAAALIELSNGDYEDAAALAKRHVENRPLAGPQAHLIAARAAIALGRYDDARKTLADLGHKPEYKTTAVLERAALERRAEGPKAAVNVVEESGIDTSDPANDALLRSLTDDLVAVGRTDDALARVAAAEKKQGVTADLEDVRGRVLFAAGRTDAARAAFQKALEVDPDYPGAHEALARLDVMAGNTASALAHAERAADGSKDAAASYLTAQILLSQGRQDDAVKRLREALARDPAQASAANDLAWLLAERGEDLDTALDLAQRAVRLDGRPEFLDTLGWVQFKHGDAGGAVASFQRALAAEPDAASVRYRLGLALESLGRQKEARDALRTALGAGTFPEAEAARAELARLEASGQAQP